MILSSPRHERPEKSTQTSLHTSRNILATVPDEMLQLAFSIHGLRRHPQKLPDQVVEQSAAAMLPGGGELVIAGDSTIIQFYDASRHRHLDKLQVLASIFLCSAIKDLICISYVHVLSFCLLIELICLVWAFTGILRKITLSYICRDEGLEMEVWKQSRPHMQNKDSEQLACRF